MSTIPHPEPGDQDDGSVEAISPRAERESGVIDRSDATTAQGGHVVEEVVVTDQPAAASVTPRPPHSKIVGVLRGLALVTLATIVLLANLVAAVLLFAGTGRARNLAVRIGVQQAQPVFPGGFSIGSSEGSLLSGVVLHDVVVNDLDGRSAISIDRVDVAYDLCSLVFARVHVERLDVGGVFVVQRPLSDGRDNLATIANVKKSTAPIPKSLPVSVLVDALDIDARYVKLDKGMTVEQVPHERDVKAHVSLHADLSHGLVASIGDLKVDLKSPMHAHVDVHGGVHIADNTSFRHLVVRMSGDTTSLHRQVEQLKLEGAVNVVATANGALDDLDATIHASTSTPRIHVSASAHVAGDRAVLRRLDIKSPFANVDAHGTYAFDQTGFGEAHVSATDLRPLALFGAPPMTGAITLDAKVSRDQAHTQATLKGLVTHFSIAKNRIDKVTIDVDTKDIAGHASIAAGGLDLGVISLRTANVDLTGDVHELRADISAGGSDGVDLQLVLRGAPRLFENHLLGLELSLDKLRFSGGGTPWISAHSAHVSADLLTRLVSLSRLDLRNGDQQISVEGRYFANALESTFVEVKHFDLSQLPAVLSPGHVLPHTDVNASLDASGELDNPNIGGKVEVAADGRGKHDMIRMTATAEGRLQDHRLNAKAFATIGGQKVSVKVDAPVPLRPNEPIDVSFDTKVLLSPFFADIIVPKFIQNQPILLYSLGALVTAQGTIAGTTSNPQLNASARVARWGAGNSHGNFGFSAEYKSKSLDLSSTLELSSLPAGGGSGAGVVEATASVPMDLAPVLSGTGGPIVARDAPLHAVVKANHVDIAFLPFEALAIVPIVGRGKVEANIEVAGSFGHPKASVKLDAKGLDIAGLDGVALLGSADVDGVASTVDLRFSVAGREGLYVHGSVGDGKGDFGSWRDWLRAPIAAQAESVNFDLGRLRLFNPMNGVVNGKGTITGTLDRPIISATLSIPNLYSGKTRYQTFDAKVHLADNVLAGELSSAQDAAHTIVARVSAQLGGGPLRGTVDATDYRVDMESELLPRLRVLRAVVDGHVNLGGTTDKPNMEGSMSLSNGQLLLASSAISYQNVSAKLAFSGESLEVASLAGGVGDDGKFEASGRLTLDEYGISGLKGLAHLHHVPVIWTTLTAYGDGDLDLGGKRTSGALLVTAVLEGARLDIQNDYDTRGLIDTTRLEDVMAPQARPQPIASPVQETKSPVVAALSDSHLVVSLTGPVAVTGRELEAKLMSALRIDLSGSIPMARGVITFDDGAKIHLYGDDYTIAHGSLRFDGTSEPEVQLRLLRPISSGQAGHTIGVELGGTSRIPTMHFFSSAATDNVTEIASLVTKQPQKDGGIVKKGMRGKTMGPISSLISTSFLLSNPASDVVDVEHPSILSPKMKAQAKESSEALVSH